MRTETRHRLKEDPFAESARETVDWARDHSINLVGGVVVATVIIALALGGWTYYEKRETQANLELGQGLRTMGATIAAERAPGMGETYPTAQAREQAAEKKFQGVVGRYGWTHAGKMAAYMIGAARMQAGDNAGAERQFKQIAASNNQDLASLANMALASIYASNGKQADAIAIYKGLMDKPARTVSKAEAQFQLAALYAPTQPKEAMKIYQQMQAEDPTGAVAQVAMMKMAALKQ